MALGQKELTHGNKDNYDEDSARPCQISRREAKLVGGDFEFMALLLDRIDGPVPLSIEAAGYGPVDVNVHFVTEGTDNGNPDT